MKEGERVLQVQRVQRGGVRRIKIRRRREYVWGDARRCLDRRLPSCRQPSFAGRCSVEANMAVGKTDEESGEVAAHGGKA